LSRRRTSKASACALLIALAVLGGHAIAHAQLGGYDSIPYLGFVAVDLVKQIREIDAEIAARRGYGSAADDLRARRAELQGHLEFNLDMYKPLLSACLRSQSLTPSDARGLLDRQTPAMCLFQPLMCVCGAPRDPTFVIGSEHEWIPGREMCEELFAERRGVVVGVATLEYAAVVCRRQFGWPSTAIQALVTRSVHGILFSRRDIAERFVELMLRGGPDAKRKPLFIVPPDRAKPLYPAAADGLDPYLIFSTRSILLVEEAQAGGVEAILLSGARRIAAAGRPYTFDQAKEAALAELQRSGVERLDADVRVPVDDRVSVPMWKAASAGLVVYAEEGIVGPAFVWARSPDPVVTATSFVAVEKEILRLGAENPALRIARIVIVSHGWSELAARGGAIGFADYWAERTRASRVQSQVQRLESAVGHFLAQSVVLEFHACRTGRDERFLVAAARGISPERMVRVRGYVGMTNAMTFGKGRSVDCDRSGCSGVTGEDPLQWVNREEALGAADVVYCRYAGRCLSALLEAVAEAEVDAKIAARSESEAARSGPTLTATTMPTEEIEWLRRRMPWRHAKFWIARSGDASRRILTPQGVRDGRPGETAFPVAEVAF